MSARRILIVDDDPAVRALLRMTLPVEGFEIVDAPDGERALDLIAERVPDVVLLDWSMPGTTGGEVLTELRERGVTVPVIVLTAEAAPRYRERAVELGAASFLTKPFSPLELLAEVERLLPGSTHV